MSPKLAISISPHIRTRETVPRIMWTVVLVLLPAGIFSCLNFGWHVLSVIAACVITAVVLEALIQKLRGKEITISDGSAVLTGLLLAYNLSPALPIWMAIIGTVVAIAIGKHAFGGLGHNIWNPALVGRAFLMAAYPGAMTTWFPSRLAGAVDAMTYATPLNVIKQSLPQSLPSLGEMFFGIRGGCIGETCCLLLLLGGLFLLWKGYITWHIPVAFLGSLACFAVIASGGKPQAAVFAICAGGAMLGSIYMATDYVTSPVSVRGMLIFGIGCGIITGVIRKWGGYPEGVCYAILLMNSATPLIDRLTLPRAYGEAKRKVWV
ncbi:MAG: RnfABCDGE type electron transport complex subunit D [Candidatus Tritonobacter lacicola]|nr:RnfABCDGE type electron transport complex subunit D [Candidatus Tritonobacter lacicola]